MKKLLFLLGGLVCIGIGIFLTFGLQYVKTNFGWYVGYMSFAYLIGICNILFAVNMWQKKIRK